MMNAYILAVALEAMGEHCESEQIVEFATSVGYYYTDRIERYLSDWNCHDIVRLLDNERERVREEAIDYQREWDSLDMWQIQHMSNYFECAGKQFNLLDEFRENAIC